MRRKLLSLRADGYAGYGDGGDGGVPRRLAKELFLNLSPNLNPTMSLLRAIHKSEVE